MSSFRFQVKVKKTPFQKQKEAEEKKRRRDDEETQKLYEDFVKDFGDDDDEGRTMLKTKKVKKNVKSVFGSDDEEPEVEEVQKTRHAPYHAGQPVGSPLVRYQPGGKVRQIDVFLENLKRDQAEREQKKTETPPTDHQVVDGVLPGDYPSTNIFIQNLAPEVDENILLREFGRFGPIGSVKIMWPRDEEQRRRGKNNGFVAFMNRKDAEEAMKELDGIMLHDMPLAMGWGKWVPLPAVPIWPPPGGVAVIPESTRQRVGDGPPVKEKVVGVGPDIVVQIPEDERVRFVIDAMAYYVLKDGCDIEQAMMQRESQNPEFRFLFDIKSAEHIYYRWRIFSLANGDNLKQWRADPFLLIQQSSRWIPPPMTMMQSKPDVSTGKSKHERGTNPLSSSSRLKLENMLQSLSISRKAIGDIMVHVIDHADSCQEVSTILVDTFSSFESVNQRVALLFLISDILHNTSAPVRNASLYRSALQESLPDIFEELQQCYREAPSRMAQEFLRKHVLRVLRIWRDWYMFTDDYLNGLQASFLAYRIDPSGKIIDDRLESNHDEDYKSKLEGMTNEELIQLCRRHGVSFKGGKQVQILRLLAVHAHITGSS